MLLLPQPDKKKGDLDLTSFAALMTGGGGGAIVEPGNAESSRIWTTCAKKEEPFMPPEGSPFGPKELDVIAKWIAGGVLDTKSSLAKKSAKPKIDMGVAVTSGRPAGPIAKPENVLLEPVIVTPRTTAVVAMAASPGPLFWPLQVKSRFCFTIPTPSNWPEFSLTLKVMRVL
jgi:hypothetical protein